MVDPVMFCDKGLVINNKIIPLCKEKDIANSYVLN